MLSTKQKIEEYNEYTYPSEEQSPMIYKSNNEQKEFEDSKSQSFRIVVPDQQYEDTKTDETNGLVENETLKTNQYSLDNRKPITFNTRPLAYLQEDDTFLNTKRPFYEKKSKKNNVKCSDTSKLFKNEILPEKRLLILENKNNETTLDLQPTNHEVSKEIESEVADSVVDCNDESEEVVTVTPTTIVENGAGNIF